MPDGPPLAWLVALLCVYLVVAPFLFGGVGDVFTASLVISGVVVAVLAAYRGMKADEEVPLPALPLVIAILGLWTIVSPFVLGSGLNSTLGTTLVVAGVVVTVIPAAMIVQVMRSKRTTAA